MNILYLASKSQSRRMLLEDAKITYSLLSQDADESQCNWGSTLQKVVESIAVHKMEHVILPKGTEGKIIFVLTADTLSQDPTGALQGKPDDMQDAITKIKATAQGVNRCGTAFCLERKLYTNDAWLTQERIIKFVDAQYEFIIPDHWIERYLKDGGNILDAAGATRIEGYGAQFMKLMHGSYSTIVGLPMFELREALEKIGFYA